MVPSLHFKNAFWSQKQFDSFPDFQSGFQILHQKLNQSQVENEELVLFFRERIAIEDNYGNRLIEQSKVSPKPIGFGRDEGATLLRCFSNLRDSSQQLGQQHKTTANTLTSQVLIPLLNFQEDYKRTIQLSKAAIESCLKQFELQQKEVEKQKIIYDKKQKDADKAEEFALKQIPQEEEKIDEPIQLGNQILTQNEFNLLIRQMKQTIPIQDYRVPILGTYRYTSDGEAISSWLQQNLPQCKDSPGMAEIIGQQLIQPYHVLRLVGQRGNKFISSCQNIYQWIEEGSKPDIGETHKKSRIEAQKADELYRSCILKLDQIRMAMEESMFSHLSEMENIELKRLETLKNIISSFIATLSVSIPQDKLIIEEMMVYQESLKPNQDIQYIIQQYAVSSFSPKPILYDNYYHGIIHDQVFGVPLEELGKKTKNKVPRFVWILLESIEKKIDKIEKKEDYWSRPIPLDKVHIASIQLNKPSDDIGLDLFEPYSPDILIGVLRYYLLELPDSLFTFEFYDPVQALLGGNNNIEDELRITSLSRLIATLPSSHFATLKLLFEYITRFIKKNNLSIESIQLIIQSFGPIILRSRVESFTVLNSKVPYRLTQELIEHYQDIFNSTIEQLHLESEKRRLAKPIIVEQKTEGLKKKSNLMSFMRPSVITTSEDLNKWAVNSVKGVFQRTTTSPIHESSPIIQPPPSILQLDSPVEEKSEIVFDTKDLFDEPSKDKDLPIDTFFFDDDEED